MPEIIGELHLSPKPGSIAEHPAKAYGDISADGMSARENTVQMSTADPEMAGSRRDGHADLLQLLLQEFAWMSGRPRHLQNVVHLEHRSVGRQEKIEAPSCLLQ